MSRRQPSTLGEPSTASDARKLKDLEEENRRLKQLVHEPLKPTSTPPGLQPRQALPPLPYTTRSNQSCQARFKDPTLTYPTSIPLNLKCRKTVYGTKAVVAVNRERVLLYWWIGRELLARQHLEGWGTRVIDRLASDLRTVFPEVKGFSSRTLKYMRTFAEAYPTEEGLHKSAPQHHPPR